MQKCPMILLENTKLATTTFNNIVSLLVPRAKEGNNSKNISYDIHEDQLTALEDHMKKLRTDWEAYKLLFEPMAETMEGATPRMTNINTTLNDHIEELDNIMKRTQLILGKHRAQYFIDLDDAVTAQKDIKSDFGNSNRYLHNHDAVIATPVKETRLPKYKAKLPSIGTMNVQRSKNRYNNYSKRFYLN